MDDELELLNQLLQEEGILPKEDQGRIEPAGPGTTPISFEQRRLWFLHELVPQSAAYNISSSFDLLGDLNHEALMYSLETIVQRQEVLRTSFRDVDGEPFQS